MWDFSVFCLRSRLIRAQWTLSQNTGLLRVMCSPSAWMSADTPLFVKGGQRSIWTVLQPERLRTVWLMFNSWVCVCVCVYIQEVGFYPYLSIVLLPPVLEIKQKFIICSSQRLCENKHKYLTRVTRLFFFFCPHKTTSARSASSPSDLCFESLNESSSFKAQHAEHTEHTEHKDDLFVVL